MAATAARALLARSLTAAVCGTGLGRVQPPEHAALAVRIAPRGALVSDEPHQLLRDGAQLAEAAADVLAELNIPLMN